MDAPTLTEDCERDLQHHGDDWYSRAEAWRKRLGPVAYRIAALVGPTPDAEMFRLLRWDPLAVATLVARSDFPEGLLDAVADDWLVRALKEDGKGDAGRIIRSILRHRSVRPGHVVFGMLWSAATEASKHPFVDTRAHAAMLMLECGNLTDDHLAGLITAFEKHPEYIISLMDHPSAGPATWDKLTTTTPSNRLAYRVTESDEIRQRPTVAAWLLKNVKTGELGQVISQRLWADAPPLQFAGGVRWLLNPAILDAPRASSSLAPRRHTPYTEEEVATFLNTGRAKTSEIAWLLHHARPDALAGLTMDEIIAMTSSDDSMLREAAFMAAGRYP